MIKLTEKDKICLEALEETCKKIEVPLFIENTNIKEIVV